MRLRGFWCRFRRVEGLTVTKEERVREERDDERESRELERNVLGRKMKRDDDIYRLNVQINNHSHESEIM